MFLVGQVMQVLPVIQGLMTVRRRDFKYSRLALQQTEEAEQSVSISVYCSKFKPNTKL
jgi:hypothetical protein